MRNTCHCGSAKNYQECCKPYIDGTAIAKTPQALMRSRYSAYSQANVDYIEATMRDKASAGFDKEQAKAWASSAEWLGLQVKDEKIKGDKGYVEFIASYAIDGKKYFTHEVSEFRCIDDTWYYVDGKQIKPRSNAPCPCGSELKYKRCCRS